MNQPKMNMHNTLDLRPLHIRTPYTPIRHFYACLGFATMLVALIIIVNLAVQLS